ncbi:hypothetical protein [Pseudomonas sp. PD9R]|uniref:hypothetical protein n=1 Tax=Pseudomonas sp. PD9R TaxID=2853534 RepID=UPI001C44959C|nr:hypothetical protein [Pseudomonas sp. PD9R]MBV6822182.1 hypothetical protein [Pseudomonas sp. PD9R]
MSENVYAPPLAQLDPAVEQPYEFYVVSPKKLMVLGTLTFGLYFYYWSYKNWSLYKRATQADIAPWARGMFCIFFIHQLYRRANEKIRGSGRIFDWDFEQWATVFVVLTVAANLLDAVAKRVDGFEFLVGWLLLIVPLRAFVLSKTQPMINFAANDPEGLSNSRFTALNYLFMVPGALFWGLSLFGAWVIYLK